VGAGLFGPIFHGKAIKRNYEASLARLDQARVQYEAAVTRSLAEVSTALVARAKLKEAESQRARTVEAFREAVRLASLRYRSGLAAYFEVLEAQQQLFPTEVNLAQTRRDQLVAVMILYRALGGGWQSEPPEASAGAP
jgi:multidrug efflux system outer membrane protein